MAKLVLSMNGVVQGEYQLDKERLSIGRKADNDIPIDNLAVSGKHAMVITILDDSFLEDLGSTNGSYVNGKLIKKHALKDGDVIAIGKHELKYVNELATADDDEFEKNHDHQAWLSQCCGSCGPGCRKSRGKRRARSCICSTHCTRTGSSGRWRWRWWYAAWPPDRVEWPNRRKRTGTD